MVPNEKVHLNTLENIFNYDSHSYLQKKNHSSKLANRDAKMKKDLFPNSRLSQAIGKKNFFIKKKFKIISKMYSSMLLINNKKFQ